MRTEWTPKARSALARNARFLRERSPGAAERAYARINGATLQLAQFPDSGRPYPRNPRRRELLVRFGSRGYAILYLVQGDVVVILDIRDQRQDGY